MTLRLAILSDIHGNPIALDAVLADVAAQGGVNGYWILGDMAALGYDPVGVLERLVALPSVVFVRGNTDRYLVTGERPSPSLAQAQAEPGLVPVLVEVAATFAWTQGYLAPTGWLDWLAALPLEQRLVLPDGTRMLGVHASPGADETPSIRPDLDDVALGALLQGCEADLVCAGHTHWPLDRSVHGTRVVNVGSVSNPWGTDLRASYTLLEAGANGYQLWPRRVDFDRAAVVEAVQRCRHPGGKFIIDHMLGKHRPPWLEGKR